MPLPPPQLPTGGGGTLRFLSLGSAAGTASPLCQLFKEPIYQPGLDCCLNYGAEREREQHYRCNYEPGYFSGQQAVSSPSGRKSDF